MNINSGKREESSGHCLGTWMGQGVWAVGMVSESHSDGNRRVTPAKGPSKLRQGLELGQEWKNA